MKVFTVGLDQKLPKDDDTLSTVTEKNGPPPSYVSASPQTMAPFSHQPAIIVQRKSRGYKGILLVMLTVFLIALFALTISEIAYNRQRDDNFLKLRWAELKHRMGYTPSEQGPFNMFQRTFFRPVTNDEVPQAQAQQISESREKERSDSQPQQQRIEDEKSTQMLISPKKLSVESSSQSASNSNEAEPSGFLSNENTLRDARLMFLRKILQKIKKNAEQMGFDGTMQISVIEVEPQTENQPSDTNGQLIESQQQQQQRFPGLPPFFGHSFGNFQPHIDGRMSGVPFSEVPAQPFFMQNNEIDEQRRPHHPFEFFPPQPSTFELNPQISGWPRFELPRQPSTQLMTDSSSPILSRPIGVWGSDNLRQQNFPNPRQSASNDRGEVYGRRFSDILRDIISNRIQNFQHLNMLNQQQQQQQPLAQQQQQISQFPVQNAQKQERQQPIELPRITFQNDFFPPPESADHQASNANMIPPKKIDEQKPKEFVSGEIGSENAGNNNQPGSADDWLVAKNEKPEAEQKSPEQAGEKLEFTPMPMVAIMEDSDDAKNKKEKETKENADGINSNLWQPVPNAESKVNSNMWQPTSNIEPKTKQQEKEENKSGQDQVQVQFQQQHFPNVPNVPFFFQVDDPKQHILTP